MSRALLIAGMFVIVLVETATEYLTGVNWSDCKTKCVDNDLAIATADAVADDPLSVK